MWQSLGFAIQFALGFGVDNIDVKVLPCCCTCSLLLAWPSSYCFVLKRALFTTLLDAPVCFLQLGILLALQVLGGASLYYVHNSVVPLDAVIDPQAESKGVRACFRQFVD